MEIFKKEFENVSVFPPPSPETQKRAVYFFRQKISILGWYLPFLPLFSEISYHGPPITAQSYSTLKKKVLNNLKFHVKGTPTKKVASNGHTLKNTSVY